MILEGIMFVLLFILTGLCAGLFVISIEWKLHQEYSEPSDWPEDDDWTIISEVKDEHR